MKVHALTLLMASAALVAEAGSVPMRARNGMVVSQNAIASQVGVSMLAGGGNAMDAAVATAFALAVIHPAAGNIGGGGFIVYRAAQGEAGVYDFREVAPAAASPTMFLNDGEYDPVLHRHSHLAVGVPGTVAGLYQAWRGHGQLPWEQLLEPAIAMAGEGFMVTEGLARSLKAALPDMKPYPSSVRQFSRGGTPYEAGDILQQPDLAETLERIADQGPKGFYDGKIAGLIEKEMRRGGGLITREDLRSYQVVRRTPLRGTYRGLEILSMPPPSSGGVVLLQALNTLEEYDLPGMGFGSAAYLHHLTETMRRAFADRARHLGDSGFVDVPVERLISKAYAEELRRTIQPRKASVSTPSSFEWPAQGRETTHVSVVDRERNAVSLTYTLEASYGSKIVVPGAGFLLNNEMGDFNPVPGVTDESGLIGTEPNLVAPGKRMLSSMTPSILVGEDGEMLVLGSPGGRRIPNIVIQTVVNVVDFRMNVQEAIDAPRVHHQWLPDLLRYERLGFSPDTLDILRDWGHQVDAVDSMGAVQAIKVSEKGRLLEGGSDRRRPDGAAVGH